MKNFYQLWRFLTEQNPPPQPGQAPPQQGQQVQQQQGQGQGQTAQGQGQPAQQGQPDQATQQKVAAALQQNPAAAQALQNDQSLQQKLMQAIAQQGPNADVTALINSLVPQQQPANNATGQNVQGGNTAGQAMNQ